MRRGVLLALVLALGLALAGCESATTDESDDTAATGETSAPVSLEGLDAISTDGANESAALAAAEKAFAAERTKDRWSGVDFDALASAGPRLVAYLVEVEMNGQVALFEVRADGIAHNIYGYQRAFDSGSTIWSPKDAQTATAPVSPGETVAVAAVDAAMRDAFPETPFAVVIHGYRFVYVAEGLRLFTLEIAPDGTLLTVSG
ncbi:MAG: hypothetical protein EG823_05685 [Actinobacteria bacterium]|nr:hypothetical protein [Actinomycetota bacterium]